MFLLVLVIARTLNNKKVELVYKYKIYELQDRLRMLAIDKEVDKSSWIYNYTDGAFTSHIKNRKYNTLFYLLMLNFKHSGEKDIIELREKVKEELSKNEQLEAIFNEFQEAHLKYILKQHSITGNFILIPVLTPIALLGDFYNYIKNSLFYPEITPSNDNDYGYAI